MAEKRGSNPNMDRLRPRGVKRKEDTIQSLDDSKRQKITTLEGLEEFEKLKRLVPALRGKNDTVSQVEIIEETIGYIDQLHKSIAERLLNSDNDGPSSHPIHLCLDHIREAEEKSKEELSTVLNSSNDSDEDPSIVDHLKRIANPLFRAETPTSSFISNQVKSNSNNNSDEEEKGSLTGDKISTSIVEETLKNSFVHYLLSTSEENDNHDTSQTCCDK